MYIHAEVKRRARRKRRYNHSGDYGRKVPPVPIPNTEVKLSYAESTLRDTAWEDRSSPLLNFYSIVVIAKRRSIYCSLAQSVEHRTVNPSVVSSSLTGAATDDVEFVSTKKRRIRHFSYLFLRKIKVNYLFYTENGRVRVSRFAETLTTNHLCR